MRWAPDDSVPNTCVCVCVPLCIGGAHLPTANIALLVAISVSAEEGGILVKVLHELAVLCWASSTERETLD